MRDIATGFSIPLPKRSPGRRCLLFVTAILLPALCCLPALAEDSSEHSAVVSGARDVGHAIGLTFHEIGQGAKNIALQIGHTAAQAGRQIGHGAAEMGRTVGEAAKEGGKELGHAIKGGD